MEYDKNKVDEVVLALLYLTMFDDKPGRRAWKSHDWDALDRLHEKGYINLDGAGIGADKEESVFSNTQPKLFSSLKISRRLRLAALIACYSSAGIYPSRR